MSTAAKQQLDDERVKRLSRAKRIVVKLGTSLVSGDDGGKPQTHIKSIVRSIAALLRESNRQIVLVSSGAVGLGARRLGLPRPRLRDLAMRQACAAVGQSLLMHTYERLFREHGIVIAQVLLTEDDFTDWRRYSNLRRTMEKLLKLGALPIINENDTVSTAELEPVETSGDSRPARVFSDNDRLAALVLSKLEADALVLLTNVDGLLVHETASLPDGLTVNETTKAISIVEEITPELKALATGPSSGGRGGMLTKLEAAEITMRAGGIAVIANGSTPRTLDRLFAGEAIGTTFLSASRMPGKRRWIAYAAGVHGRVFVNNGAHEAIVHGKASLLSSGVVRVENHFEPHEVVSIRDMEGREFARGIVNCASDEAVELVGKEQTTSSQPTTHIKPRVLVTRDNIVLVKD